MAGWQTRFALRDPLLASLHAGHAWLALGFAALAASDLGAPLPRSVAVHALTAGAMGTMILAVMTRVALGHTGRPLVAPPAANTAYVLVTLGAGVRVIGTSAAVHPAAGLIGLAAGTGARIVVINTNPSEASAIADVELIGPAGELVPGVLG